MTTKEIYVHESIINKEPASHEMSRKAEHVDRGEKEKGINHTA